MAQRHSMLPHAIGRYEVLELLGQGAMGRVYLARDPVLTRQVAIKVLRNDLDLGDAQRQVLFDRMRQEARASARVGHPNIVTLFDMGEDPDLGLYLVFEYVDGPTLKQQIETGPLPGYRIAELAVSLGSALRVAHEAGVLHRDIKPENVILASTGAKIADFGIARIPESTLTRDGHLLGTPAYGSPESIGEGTFSPLSDQFSLAATLYEAICRERAFPGDDAVAVAACVATENPLPIAGTLGLSPVVDQVLYRALAKDPAHRYPDCEEFGRALALSLDQRAEQPEPPRSTSTCPLSRDSAIGPRSLRIRVGALAALLLVVSLGVGLYRRCTHVAASQPSSRDRSWTRTDHVTLPPSGHGPMVRPSQDAMRPSPR